MCGICGSVGYDNGSLLVKKMTAAMVHRGPDSSGFLAGGPVQLGMRRLKIIDLETGDQPIYNEDGSVAVVLNGEIYNFQSLYNELNSLGHQFKTKSDTEVIVHAYEEWGIDCLNHLRGMFALAVYDSRQGNPGDLGSYRLLLARDRLGIKPLYVWKSAQKILFSSEVRSLLASGSIPKTLDQGAVYTYLAFGSVQEPLTLIEGIRSLKPGSWLEIDVRGEYFETKQGSYWKPDLTSKIAPAPGEVRDWLLDAVDSHLVSDVPLGAFLSGGIDSGSIVALASQALDNPLKTFTLGFDNWPADERELAELTSQLWKTDHKCRLIDEDNILADLPDALASMDQPTLDGVNSWYVSREAKASGLTVALSGVGGDELFAGYPSFRYVPILKLLPRLKRQRDVSTIAGSTLIGGTDFRRKALAYIVRDLPINHPYFVVRSLLTESGIKGILPDRSWEYIQENGGPLQDWYSSVEHQISRASDCDQVTEISWLEMTQYMRSTLLRDTDMMSMAHSLEVRVPLLDHILVEKILSISGKHKKKAGKQKYLLTQALGADLPEEITSMTKRTFTFPFQVWLREGLAREIQKELTETEGEQMNWAKPEGLAGIWHDFERGHTNWARPWSIYVLKKWIKNNL